MVRAFPPSAGATLSAATGRGNIMNTNGRAALAAFCLALSLASCKSSGKNGGSSSVEGPATIEIVTGDGQSAPVSTRVTQAPTVVVRGASGGAVAGAIVSFEIQDGGGSVDASIATTDAAGHASTGWTLGPTPGLNHLRASTTGVTPTVTFAATGTASVVLPARLEIVGGDGQTASPGTAVGVAPTVVVLDAQGAPVSGIEVSFAVMGGGSLERNTDRTNASGQGSCGNWTLGSTKGLQTLIATVAQLPPVTFTATAANTSTDVQLVVPSPSVGDRVHDTVTIYADVVSTFEIAVVTASVDERSVELAFSGSTPASKRWSGTLSLAGRARGPLVLVVTATDVFNHYTDVVVPLMLDRPPTVVVSAPLSGAVARPRVYLDATCVDDDPTGCRSIIVYANGLDIAKGTASLSQELDLSQFEGQAVDLDVAGDDSSGQSSHVSLRAYVEPSPHLSLRAEVNGRVWDAADARVLFLDETESIPVLKVLDIVSRSTVDVEASPGLVSTDPKGFLSSTGAIYVHTGAACSLHEYRAGVTSALADLRDPCRLRVAGNWAVYSSGAGLWRRNLSSGESIFVASAKLDSGDVSTNGDVVFCGSSDGDVYRWRDGSAQALTNHGIPYVTEYFAPTTDGANVVYSTFLNGCLPILGCLPYRIAVHDGVTQNYLTPPQTIWGRYAAAGGFVAYGSEDVALVSQIWRYKAGVSEQLSFFGSTPSSIDSIGTDGTVLFTHGQKRYRARPGAALEEIGSALGRVIYRDGEFLVLLGNAVFAVGP